MRHDQFSFIEQLQIEKNQQEVPKRENGAKEENEGQNQKIKFEKIRQNLDNYI